MQTENTLESNFISLSSLNSDEINEIISDSHNFIGDNFLNAEIQVLSLIINKNNVEDIYSFKTNKPNKRHRNRLLPYAIISERCDLIDFLLSIGADPNSVSEHFGMKHDRTKIHHTTCLSISCRSKNRSIIEKLLQGGADPNFVPAPKISIRDIMLNHFSIEVLKTASPRHPMYWAIMYDNHDYVDLLMAYDADINFDNGNMYSTPFYGMLNFLLNNSSCCDLDKRKRRVQRLVNFLDKGVLLKEIKHPYLAHITLNCWSEELSCDLFKCLLERDINPCLQLIQFGGHDVSPATDKIFFDPNDPYGNYEKVMRICSFNSVFSCLNLRCFKLFRTLLDYRVPMPLNDTTRSCLIYLKNHKAFDQMNLLRQLIDAKESNYFEIVQID